MQPSQCLLTTHCVPSVVSPKNKHTVLQKYHFSYFPLKTLISLDICIELRRHHTHKVGIYVFSLNFTLAAGILSTLIPFQNSEYSSDYFSNSELVTGIMLFFTSIGNEM